MKTLTQKPPQTLVDLKTLVFDFQHVVFQSKSHQSLEYVIFQFPIARSRMQACITKYGAYMLANPALNTEDIKTLRTTLNRHLELHDLNLNVPSTWQDWPEPRQLHTQCFNSISKDEAIVTSLKKIPFLKQIRLTGVDLQPPAFPKPMPFLYNPLILNRSAPYHGSIQLTAQKLQVGSVWIMTGSHLLYKEFCRKFDHDMDDYDKPIALTATEMAWYSAELQKLGYPGKLQRVIGQEAGQVVIWDSRLVCCLYVATSQPIPEKEVPELATQALKDVRVMDPYWRQALYFDCQCPLPRARRQTTA